MADHDGVVKRTGVEHREQVIGVGVEPKRGRQRMAVAAAAQVDGEQCGIVAERIRDRQP